MKYKVTVWLMAIIIIGLSLMNILQPDKTYSMSERRKLKQFPAFTTTSVLSGKFMKEFEEYTQDQFVGREEFRTLKAVSELYAFAKKDNNNIYVADGYASAIEYPMDEESIDHAMKRFHQIYTKYLEGIADKVFISIIPDKNYYLAEKNGYLSMDYDALFDVVENKSGSMEYIPLENQLTIEDYYFTDTHWKQECLLDVMKYLAEQMTDVERHDYLMEPYEEVRFSDDFYGVYAGQSALPLQADELIYLDNETLKNCIVHDYQNNVQKTIYDVELAKGNDPYELFLSGDISLMTVTNPNGQTGKDLVLFRDSFGSSIAPLFLEYYDSVTLIDIRYIMPDLIGNYIDFEGKDVLFLYSTLVLNNSETFK